MATLWKGAEVPEAEEDLPKGRWLGRMWLSHPATLRSLFVPLPTGQVLSCSVHFSPLKGLAYILSSEETLGPSPPPFLLRVLHPQQRAVLLVVIALFHPIRL